MPEYLAPGVYVEETSYRARSIEGVSTTTTGFIGPTRYGPVDLEPDIVTSLGEFERTYGDGQPIAYGDSKMDNYMWHAARAFFTEGGKRLYVSRVFRPLDSEEDDEDAGCASASAGSGDEVTFKARYPGAYGNFTVRLTVKTGANVLGSVKDRNGNVQATLGAVADRDVIWIRGPVVSSPPSGSAGDVYLLERSTSDPMNWTFSSAVGSPIASPLVESTATLSSLDPTSGEGRNASVRVVTVTVALYDSDGLPLAVWADLPLDPEHRTSGAKDSLFGTFGDGPEQSGLPIVVTASAGLSGLDVLEALRQSYEDTSPSVVKDFSTGDDLAAGISWDIDLAGGNDGQRPGVAEYEGVDRYLEGDDGAKRGRTGLKQFEAIDDISIVAAPGSTADYTAYRDDANGIMGLLLAHAQNMRYRIAVLDSAPKQTIKDVRGMRAKLDSTYGALYYPWVKVMDPITRAVIPLPPSGFVAGIYARNDIARAVFKAPANEVVNLALGFETMLSKAQQDVLNPEGVNCFRYFEGRGMLLWGARTTSSDPEWKYVNVRRYFAYLEHSIDKGTQWAVFEPNNERLWANVRRTIEDFLLNEFQMGAMVGDKPEKAYFVKCDRTTMTQNDLDNGRLVCLVGVAAVKPAEFVVFRIGQWTADHKV